MAECQKYLLWGSAKNVRPLLIHLTGSSCSKTPLRFGQSSRPSPGRNVNDYVHKCTHTPPTHTHFCTQFQGFLSWEALLEVKALVLQMRGPRLHKRGCSWSSSQCPGRVPAAGAPAVPCGPPAENVPPPAAQPAAPRPPCPRPPAPPRGAPISAPCPRWQASG